MGMDVFIIGFSDLSKTRKIKHGQLSYRKRDQIDLTPITFYHLVCYVEYRNLCIFSLVVFRAFRKECHRQVNICNCLVMN